MNAARFVLIRHGRTQWNAQGRWLGATDIPLDAVGRAQAGAAAGWFAHLEPVAIWASPLARAQQTAQPVAELTGQPVNTDARLAELDFGAREGMTWSQIERAQPELWAWRRGEHDCRWGVTGETGGEVAARMSAALVHIDASTPQGTILVFSHGTAIRMGIGGLLGWDFPTSWRLDSIANCCASSLHHSGDRNSGHQWRLGRYNAEPQWNLGA
ncbi:probable phosphoglycerate mutase [Propionibacterium cyclohexanicum]|uniref:Probable phosphoglycerate mutase n=1 Tax=Propionibacterium cyclohexanicum TaxID=64702 RepID=A0A1H9Q6D9_9ACTN|nr:histidine phosphatase family protein [Propionibacterium cyclohexanicum]SER55479.1 probable phosphoglycerate mutase [Propionibacterium cyclohexanicum]